MRRRFSALCLAAAGLCAGLTAPVPVGAATAPLVITYEVRGRGNVSDLDALAAEASAVYADPRGWGLGGSIRFDRVKEGGDFTLWLAADALMSTFGGACDVEWSCRNGRHVVINEDRWLGASEAWNAAGASLGAYRQMVLNHETGHWLGFGHAFCSGAGRPAPVMQQQSMSLTACRPNPWPMPAERAALATRRRVQIVQTGGIAEPASPPAAMPSPGAPPAARRPPVDGTCLTPSGGAALRPWTRCLLT